MKSHWVLTIFQNIFSFWGSWYHSKTLLKIFGWKCLHDVSMHVKIVPFSFFGWKKFEVPHLSLANFFQCVCQGLKGEIDFNVFSLRHRINYKWLNKAWYNWLTDLDPYSIYSSVLLQERVFILVALYVVKCVCKIVKYV